MYISTMVVMRTIIWTFWQKQSFGQDYIVENRDLLNSAQVLIINWVVILTVSYQLSLMGI